MILISYVDLYGKDEKIVSTMSPMDIDKSDILTISPMITSTGKLFKNVSFIKDRHGNGYKVVGNYKNLISKIKNNNNPDIGF